MPVCSALATSGMVITTPLVPQLQQLHLVLVQPAHAQVSHVVGFADLVFGIEDAGAAADRHQRHDARPLRDDTFVDPGQQAAGGIGAVQMRQRVVQIGQAEAECQLAGLSWADTPGRPC